MKRFAILFAAVLFFCTMPAYGMVCLDNSDTLEGGASVDAVVDYTVHGMVSGAFTNIAQGQLSDTDPSVLYTAATDISIVSVIYVNTHSAAVTVNLYLDPANAGTPRRMIPEAMTLQVGYSMVFDGQRCTVIDTNGGVVAGTSVSDVAYGAGWDSVTTIAPSKNTVYDILNGAITKLLVGGGAAAAPVWTEATGTDAPVRAGSPTFTNQITTPKVLGGTSTTQDLDFQTTSGVGEAGADMHFRVGNNGATDAMMILNNGSVGIGTTAPDAALEINHATGDSMRLTYNDANGSAANYVDFAVSSSGDLTITPSGGDVSLASANLLFTSGKGIDFSATANAAGMTSELLDDYE
ncbi:MAG: hypothetical protein WAO76_10325, partial [Georgfuchsia sp.]